ncbi:hypothetical protein GIB67_042151 [Kingdonia uniflora]|uniref:Major facilitator superfamily (MFS) profile domain-containing protein n=1 Tax=Kingdonia uniflora TaxID=39325 RepID=A0A7J7NWQ6_9MAGN|nr:hypothetical protein GIB67_042151 [Kingdonia uniflora]
MLIKRKENHSCQVPMVKNFFYQLPSLVPENLNDKTCSPKQPSRSFYIHATSYYMFDKVSIHDQIGVGLMVCQQFGGINGVCFYVSDIFVSAGFPANLGTIIYAILQVVVTALGASMIDKAGRRALLLISGTGLVIGCVLTAVSFYLKAHELSLDSVPLLAVAGVLVYIGSFSIGMGAVPWVVMSEIFPINVKGVAGSLATLVNWFGSWVVSYTFNYLMSWSSYGISFYSPLNIKNVMKL